jgi:hypothetical protein
MLADFKPQVARDWIEWLGDVGLAYDLVGRLEYVTWGEPQPGHLRHAVGQ